MIVCWWSFSLHIELALEFKEVGHGFTWPRTEKWLKFLCTIINLTGYIQQGMSWPGEQLPSFQRRSCIVELRYTRTVRNQSYKPFTKELRADRIGECLLPFALNLFNFMHWVQRNNMTRDFLSVYFSQISAKQVNVVLNVFFSFHWLNS
jgi:hypothetical protein